LLSCHLSNKQIPRFLHSFLHLTPSLFHVVQEEVRCFVWSSESSSVSFDIWEKSKKTLRVNFPSSVSHRENSNCSTVRSICVIN
jgi:hypothetical protein